MKCLAVQSTLAWYIIPLNDVQATDLLPRMNREAFAAAVVEKMKIVGAL